MGPSGGGGGGGAGRQPSKPLGAGEGVKHIGWGAVHQPPPPPEKDSGALADATEKPRRPKGSGFTRIPVHQVDQPPADNEEGGSKSNLPPLSSNTTKIPAVPKQVPLPDNSTEAQIEEARIRHRNVIAEWVWTTDETYREYDKSLNEEELKKQKTWSEKYAQTREQVTKRTVT